MDVVAENIKYIELGIETEMYRDEHQRVYVIPSRDVPYAELFRGICTRFVDFYEYATTFRKETERTEVGTLLAHYRALGHTAALEEYVRGFKRVQRLVAENVPNRALGRKRTHDARMKKRGEIRESETNRLFLEGNVQITYLTTHELYRADHAVSQHYFEKGFYALAVRFAKEALDIATKTSSSQGIELSTQMLAKIEEREKEESMQAQNRRGEWRGV
ncbi:hypothetical protein NECID01_1011 [Nematocida sp. AWRm77]|nr:hypothetical protein NECID01_1011 [Nematocida sp. AWRm77]